jgi:hypothetical protein
MTDLSDIPEALRGQVVQLRAERANAVAYGQKDIVAAVDRTLAALGVRDDDELASATEPEVEQRVAQARTTPPQGRSTKPTATTTKG